MSKVEEPEGPDAILRDDDDDVVFGGQNVGVVNVQGGRSGDVASPINPDQDGHLPLVRVPVFFGGMLRRPDVHVQAVFGNVGVWGPGDLAAEAGKGHEHFLVAGVRLVNRVQGPVPGLDWDRLTEAEIGTI